jgi:hypothetical protein
VNRDFGIRAALAHMEVVVQRARGNAIIRDWAQRVVGDNVAYPTPASKARGLLDMIRRVAPYMAEPTYDEHVALPTVPRGGLRVDADDEAVMLASACESLGLTVKLRLVQQNHACSVAVDVQQGPDWVTFAMGEKR